MYLDTFFMDIVPLPGDRLPLVGYYRADLLVLSVAIAVCGAWAGMTCLSRAEAVQENRPSGGMLWKVAGGVGFGGSIWGMHFVGMLSFSLPCGVSYDFTTTAISVLPGIVASMTALGVVSRSDFGQQIRLVVGSLLMGIGIGAMHYMGMAAMRLPATLLYDPTVVALSLAAAAILSYCALSIAEYGRRHANLFRYGQFAAAVVLGGAVSTMHYVAMEAAIFYPADAIDSQAESLSDGVLALFVGLGTLALAGAVGAASFAARLSETARTLEQVAAQRAVAEKAARADQARLQAIFDTAAVAIVVIDRNGRIERWSKGAEETFGYSALEAVGDNIAIVTGALGLSEKDAFIPHDQEGGKAEPIGIGREIAGRRKDGSSVALELSVAETVIDGEVLYTGILRDVSHRKAMQQELLEAARAREANELKTNFLANMSHEMRTPLNAILGFSDIMRTEVFGPMNEPYASYATDIFSSGNHLLNLVNALLDLSKIEHNEQDIRIADADLREILNDTVKLLREQANQKRLTLATIIDSDTPEAIRTDGGKLYQVLINLVGNAIKYTPEKGRIDMRVSADANRVRIVIEDTGIGMTETEIDTALQPFGQIKNALTAGIAGTGLGLPIAASFVALLQGEMRIESRKGAGTSVRILLPRIFDEGATARRSVAG